MITFTTATITTKVYSCTQPFIATHSIVDIQSTGQVCPQLLSGDHTDSYRDTLRQHSSLKVAS